jgi:hypothetical protein
VCEWLRVLLTGDSTFINAEARNWKEAVVECWKDLSRNTIGETEERHVKCRSLSVTQLRFEPDASGIQVWIPATLACSFLQRLFYGLILYTFPVGLRGNVEKLEYV